MSHHIMYRRSGNFHVVKFLRFNFSEKIFSWSRIPMKIFFYIPRFSDLKQDYTHSWSKTACCIHGYHTAFGKLLTCEREVKNAIGTYCGSKDRRFLGHWGLSRKLSHVCHEPPAVSKRLSHTKQLASCAVKLWRAQKCADCNEYLL